MDPPAQPLPTLPPSWLTLTPAPPPHPTPSKDGPKDFYTVYAQLFAALDAEECASTPGRAAAPGFGSSAEPWAEVREFYATWETFATSRSCAQYDKHDLRRAEDRKVRRLMEKEGS